VAENLEPTTSKKTILVVDDDVKMRALLREILNILPHDIVEAGDGQEALNIIRQRKVDLIITDRSMPRMDGLQFLKKLRERDKNTPVLMMSAYGDEELWASAVGLGAEDYLLKPFTPESVIKVVNGQLS
jgi:CheY-like chemotaxis protein